ncbi:MAG: TOBE domain-containing protein, partial [Phycisphaerae bacterium]
QAFLFDEPLSSLDATLRLQMRAELRRLHGTLGITTIYVTHDQEEALTVGDRVAVIRGGAVYQCAGPREVYDRPANRFVAAFIGMPPMNFLDGRISAESGRLHFDAGAFRLALPDCFHPALGRWVGRHAVLGVRPTDLAPAEGTETARGRFAGEGNRLEARITALEPLGEKIDLHVATSDGQTVVCRTDARGGLTDGTTLTLCLDMRRVHVFEPGAEGVNIGLSCAGDQASAA